MLQFLFFENAVFFGGFLFMLALGLLSLVGGDVDADGGADAGLDLDVDVDLDLDLDIDVDMNVAAPDAGALLDIGEGLELSEDAGEVASTGGLLGMLLPRGVPLTITLAIYAICFCIVGYIAQFTALQIIGRGLPMFMAVPIAIAGAWAIGRWLAGLVGAHLLKTETAALGPRQFMGLSGTITVGIATAHRSAEVRVVDRYGNPHYVRGRASTDGDTLSGEVRISGYRKDRQEFLLRANG